MADTHEEQLLSELLGDIAREDVRLVAAHLETSVLAAASFRVRERTPRTRAWVLLPVAAVIVAAVAVTLMVRPKPNATVRLKPETTDATPGVEQIRGATEVTIHKTPRVAVRSGPRPAPPQQDRLVDVAVIDSKEAPVAAAPVVDSPLVTSPIEFVPLMPITEHELTGSFQIVRVQMPSASLGALRSPLTGPNELVEADVLLGEDGRARAIRVNANESIYPWRPR